MLKYFPLFAEATHGSDVAGRPWGCSTPMPDAMKKIFVVQQQQCNVQQNKDETDVLPSCY